MSTRIATFCIHHILDNGASSLDALATAARDAEVTRARNPLSAVRTGIQHDPRLVELPDGRWDCALRLLDGAVLTHRVRAATAGRDLLFPDIELAPLTVLLDHGPLPLAAGGELTKTGGRRTPWDGQQVVVGPPGWLPDLAADALVGLTWSASPGLAVQVADLDPELGAAQTEERIDRVRAIVTRHAIGRVQQAPRPTAAEFARILWSALIEVPDLLSDPVPPLDEVLDLPPTPWPSGEPRVRTYRGQGLRGRYWSDDPWRGATDAYDGWTPPDEEPWNDDFERMGPW